MVHRQPAFGDHQPLEPIPSVESCGQMMEADCHEVRSHCQQLAPAACGQAPPALVSCSWLKPHTMIQG